MGEDIPEIDIGRIVKLPDEHHRHPGEWVELIDWKRPFKHMKGVWAYADPETGEYGGLVVFDNLRDLEVKEWSDSDSDA